MVKNRPVETRGSVRRSRFWPFGKRSANRRVRTPRPTPGKIDRLSAASITEPHPSESAIVTTRPIPVAADRTKRTRDTRRMVVSALKGVSALTLAVAAIAGVFATHRWLTTSAKFAVREVRVSKTAHVTADAVRARSGIEVGVNLFALDLDAVAHDVQADPWIARVDVRRELPATVAIDVVEREPACLLAFGPLYIADAAGEAWKRATPDEAASLPIVTGIPRDAYVDDRESAQAMVREGLAALAVFREHGDRPPIGEIHVDVGDGITLYTRDGVGIRIGRSDTADSWRERLGRYDLVAASLRASGDEARLILVDQRSRPDRVTVRLAAR